MPDLDGLKSSFRVCKILLYNMYKIFIKVPHLLAFTKKYSVHNRNKMKKRLFAGAIQDFRGSCTRIELI